MESAYLLLPSGVPPHTFLTTCNFLYHRVGPAWTSAESVGL